MASPDIRPIPVGELERVLIEENNEPLSKILEGERIVLLSDHKFLIPYLRKSACDKLVEAVNFLPTGHKFLIVTAYRPYSMQKKLWRNRLKQLAKKYPLKLLFNFREFKNLASKYTAPPGGSSHQTGAAVDVAIIGPDSERLDMGTTLTDFGEKCHTAFPKLTNKQKENRGLLYNAMIKAGFINYPREWWHYSYGDRMWAAYGGKTKCFYGKIEDS